MSEPQMDPAGNTQQFKAFAQRNEPEAAPAKRSLLTPILIVAGVLVVAVLAFLLFR
ncbi:hypothetical protein [Streptosporangium saharense]|uniref:hypothetical protein n=1 Tax=Streptosporangium saharense TaxID=1706840 RepID=UPI003332EB91